MADAQCVQCGQPREAHGRTNFELFGCGVFCVDDDLGQPAAATCKHSCERDALKDTIFMLVEALKGVVRVADRKTTEFDAAREAIAKAGG